MRKDLLAKLKNYRAQSKTIQRESNRLKKYGLASTATLAAMATIPVELSAQIVAGNLGAPTRVVGTCVDDLGAFYSDAFCAQFDFDHDGTYELQVRYYNYLAGPPAYMYIDPINVNLTSFFKGDYAAGYGATFPGNPTNNLTSTYTNLNGAADRLLVVPLSSGNGFGFLTLDRDLFNFENGTHQDNHPVTGQQIKSTSYAGTVLWGAQTGISQLSDIVIESDDIFEAPSFPTILPIELVSFEGNILSDDVQLSWETASELNNSGFEIERSINGVDFQTIKFVPGAGTTSDAQVYSFIDDSLLEGTTYFYRLKQIDYDGTTDFSSIVRVNIPGETIEVNIFPTLISDQTTVEIIVNKVGEAAIEVYSSHGQLVVTESVLVSSQENRFNLDVSNLSAGTYFTKVQFQDQTSYQKIIVE